MRSRTHRLPTSEPPDDWVDGSWTVDCVCGVNFDDGEEMVNCDECGVWVHTRCSRYVKSEKSFACDKCKSKSKNSRNDSCEETEVAQLLVELPTKTLRMDNPYPSDCPPRQPFRLWTDVPIEERVHVQGVPGGDPALFGGLSSVFTPELWKCTGFVPKKFNFQYREFPCWDEHVKQEFDAKIEEENENPVDKGAGVLFSLSKENVLPGMKRQVEDMKKGEVEDLDVRRPRNGVKKERSLLRPFVIHSGKRKKEDLGGTSTDRSGKKKARVVDKEGDSRNRAPHASKTASTLSSDAKQLEFYEDRGLKVLKIDTPSIKNGNLRDTEPEDPLSGGCHVVQNDVDEPKNNLASSDHPSEALSSDVSRHNFSVGARPKEDKAGHQVSARIESSPKTVDGVASILEHNDIGSLSVKEEVVGVALDSVDDNGGCSSRSVGIDSHKSEPLVEDLATVAPEAKDNQNVQDSYGDMSPSSLQPNVKVKREVDIDNSGGVFDVEPSPLDDEKLDGTKPLVQHPGMSADNLPDNVKLESGAVTSLQSGDHKVQDVDRSTAALSDCQTDKADELPGNPCQLKRQLEGSAGSMAGRKSSSEPKQGSRPAEEPSKSGGLILSPLAPLSQRKMIVSVGKSSSTSLTTVISRPSISDNQRPANTQHHNASTKQRGMSEGNVSIKKDNASTDVVRDEDGCEMPKKIPKEHLKSSVSSLLKTSHSTKISHASVSKRTLSDSKDPGLCSSSKASSVQNIVVTSGSGESASLLPTQSALHVQNKMTASGLPHRGEKVNLLNSQASSKVNNTPSMHPPAPSNSAAVLSDEELALLLHQELNSSPRVPRVPRMRHAGSLPQLASPTATSMLMKRTSSSGGKDHGLVSRRKNKDLAKDGSRSSREIDDDAKKMDRVPSSPDQRRHDSVCTTDPFTKREADNRSGKGVHSVKKCIPSASIATVSSGLSSSTEVNEQNLSSTRNSPRNASDDETGTIGGPIHRTLPGLIAEIMSKGNRMTYEELCNAVLPHWPNLRKHNGERYAYSSHSQAVLDCLRNRHEWARLVDRGPKTNASRKRRKLDAEPTSFESEDNEFGKDRTMKEVESKSFESHREEFPKGKRKARKRRRLALQGRGIKDVRRRRKAEVLSDDDIGSFSSSSEESIFSEDEIQGGGKCPVRSEASASSDEMGTL
uniref:Zinc finger PHD-type domain-containing protein n=1 Tax=Davidia involucrata TaxID=16924 RepID=A0A5B6ZNU3_DAVIN